MSEDPKPYQAGIAAEAAQQVASAPAVKDMLRAQIAGQIMAAVMVDARSHAFCDLAKIKAADYVVVATDALLEALAKDPQQLKNEMAEKLK